MAWIKVPIEHHPIFRAALPRDPRIETLLMFGGIGAKVNGHLFAGLFARSAIVHLDEPGRAEALALDGATYFNPRGDDRPFTRFVLLPEDTLHDPHDLRAWLARAFTYSASLPAKTAKKPAAKKPAAKKPAAKKSAAKKPSAKKPSAKKSVVKKPAAKKLSAKKLSAKKLSAKKLSVKKPVAKKPAAKKPSAKKPAR